MKAFPTFTVTKYLCPYCKEVFIRQKKGEPKSCVKCHYRFIGKKIIKIAEIKF